MRAVENVRSAASCPDAPIDIEALPLPATPPSPPQLLQLRPHTRIMRLGPLLDLLSPGFAGDGVEEGAEPTGLR